MEKGRLEAFTDGVVAIIITIMVLEMKVPQGADRAAIVADIPVFLAYALSYVNVGLFWNNHHHVLQATERVDGAVLWANLFLLFWLSLVPFVIRWMDETHFAAAPTAAYGAVLALAAIGYLWLEKAIIRCNGPESKLALSVGDDRKGKFSMAAYCLAVPLSFLNPWMAIAIYVLNALIWFIPDRRIEAVLS
jgi:TMEM175 potassium channel family protein